MLQYGERQVLQCSGRVATADARTMKENETLCIVNMLIYICIYTCIFILTGVYNRVISVWYRSGIETVTAAIITP